MPTIEMVDLIDIVDQLLPIIYIVAGIYLGYVTTNHLLEIFTEDKPNRKYTPTTRSRPKPKPRPKPQPTTIKCKYCGSTNQRDALECHACRAPLPKED